MLLFSIQGNKSIRKSLCTVLTAEALNISSNVAWVALIVPVTWLLEKIRFSPILELYIFFYFVTQINE